MTDLRPDVAPETPGRVRRRWIRRALQVLLVLAGFYLAFDILSEMGWQELVRQLRSAEPRVIGLICLLLSLRWVAWSLRWGLSLRRAGVPAPLWRTVPAILSAAVVNHVTPSFRIFGGLLRARYLSRFGGVSFSAAYGSVLFDQVVAQTVMGAMSALAFVLMALELGRFRQALAAALLVASLLLLIPLLLRQYRRRGPLAQPASEEVSGQERSRSIRQRIRRVWISLESLLHEPGLGAAAVSLSLLYAALNIGAAWASFHALGVAISPIKVFLAVSVGITLGAISGTPGGSVTTEAAMVMSYELLGVDASQALAGILLYRGLHYLLVLALGGPCLALLETRVRRLPVTVPDQDRSTPISAELPSEDS